MKNEIPSWELIKKVCRIYGSVYRQDRVCGRSNDQFACIAPSHHVRKTVSDLSSLAFDAVSNLLRISDGKRFENVRDMRSAVWCNTPIGEISGE